MVRGHGVKWSGVTGSNGPGLLSGSNGPGLLCSPSTWSTGPGFPNWAGVPQLVRGYGVKWSGVTYMAHWVAHWAGVTFYTTDEPKHRFYGVLPA
jgi:hypothetical protein